MVAFVMPMLSGKTTLSESSPAYFVDIDAILNGPLKEEWSEVVKTSDFDQMNKVYSKAIKIALDDPYSPSQGLLIHSCPASYGYDDMIYYVVESVDDDEFESRLSTRLSTMLEVERKEHEDLARRNRSEHKELESQNKDKVVRYQDIIKTLEGEINE
jgi:hypothetical protein